MPTDSSAVNKARAPARLSRTLPKLPAVSRIETLAALKACIPARAALSGFSQALRQSPISHIAIDSFSLLDAVGAVQLEGVPVDMAAALQHTSPASYPELHRHIEARVEAHDRLVNEPVGSTLALELASALHGKPVSVRRGDAERYESGSSSIDYRQMSAPQGAEKLQVLLEDWQGFVQHSSADLDPLLMAAAAHGQWIALRPFTQSNIAVGQILTSLLLSEEGLLPNPVLPLALYFSRHADKYWQCLYTAVVHGDHASWIQFFMTAIEEASIDATEQLMQWQKLTHELGTTMNDCLPKAPSDSLVITCARPSFGLADLALCGLGRRQTASSCMQNLVDLGVLDQVRAGKEKRYINRQVIAVLLG